MINLLVIIPILTGACFLIAGIITWKFPPRKVNNFYGYRTSRSMKTQDNWDFAQQYSAKEMIKLGVFMMLCAVAGLAYTPQATSAIILSIVIPVALLIVCILILFARVERAIDRRQRSI